MMMNVKIQRFNVVLMINDWRIVIIVVSEWLTVGHWRQVQVPAGRWWMSQLRWRVKHWRRRLVTRRRRRCWSWVIVPVVSGVRRRVSSVDHSPGGVGSWRVDWRVGVGRVEV